MNLFQLQGNGRGSIRQGKNGEGVNQERNINYFDLFNATNYVISSGVAFDRSHCQPNRW